MGQGPRGIDGQGPRGSNGQGVRQQQHTPGPPLVAPPITNTTSRRPAGAPEPPAPSASLRRVQLRPERAVRAEAADFSGPASGSVGCLWAAWGTRAPEVMRRVGCMACQACAERL